MKKTPSPHPLFQQLAEPFSAELLFDQIPDIVFFIKDSRGCYLQVNHTLVKRSGKRSKADLIGYTPADVLGERLGKRYASQDQRVLSSGEQLQDELELHTYPSGQVGWCLTSKFPLWGERNKIVGLAGVSRDLKLPDVSSEAFAHLAEALDFAEHNLARPPSLAQLAERADMSVYQLDRRMKQLFGLSTGRWLLKTRLDYARRLLLETDRQIADLALDCGYSDQSAFTRQFKRATGQTPSEFRRMA